MRQDHAFLPQNVRQKNVNDMRRKTSIYVRFVVRTFCGVTMPLSKEREKLNDYLVNYKITFINKVSTF
jgi:hypothetical protein